MRQAEVSSSYKEIDEIKKQIVGNLCISTEGLDTNILRNKYVVVASSGSGREAEFALHGDGSWSTSTFFVTRIAPEATLDELVGEFALVADEGYRELVRRAPEGNNFPVASRDYINANNSRLTLDLKSALQSTLKKLSAEQ